MKTDVLIIGGGVMGCAVAYQLAQYDLHVTVLEKSSDVANGTSKANSGIAHNGMGEKPGTLRGKYIRQGSAIIKELCEGLHVPFRYGVGSLTVGFDEDDRKKLLHLQEMGRQLGILDSEIIEGEKIFELEPYISKDVKYALFNPGISTICPYEFTIAMAESAAINQVEFLLEHEVTGMTCSNGKVACVHTNQGDFEAKVVINAAGLYADRIAAMVEEIDFEIKPRRGEYLLYDKKMGKYVHHIISNLGTDKSKGMIILPTVHGNILAGSSATMIEDKDDVATTEEKLDFIYDKVVKKIVPGLPRMGDVITTFAGNRAAATGDDFIVAHAKSVHNVINLAGIQSPGIVAAPAIARDVVAMVESCGISLIKKEGYKPFRPKPIVIQELDEVALNDLIKEQPDYGEIICRCETISKGEILAAIHAPIPATTVDAIKRRTRAGMGRCQGGFCGPRILEILAQELGVDMTEVCKGNKGSNMVKGQTKEGIQI